ncbi:MAG: histidinol dehydrogenase [Microthrixaceae bacterium]|nr:histidinol dehydrogenase [Microthrixaceae bacterium]
MLNRLDLRAIDGEIVGHLPRPEIAGEGPVAAVREILQRVRSGGDEALLACTREFDGVSLDSLRVHPTEVAAALDRIDAGVREALGVAASRIEAFHRTQLHPSTVYEDGGSIRSFAVPMESAGCYVPGGRAAYPSTVLMTAIPAKVAGVDRVVVCVPPARDSGTVADITLAACAVAGVDEVYAIGGAQAIGALAYGTESVAKVDVICGPGNKYVAIAKREVADAVGIASAFAGPSEIVVVADESAPPAFAAVDVVVQAEHGPDGLAWLVCWDESVADAVSAEVMRITEASPRRSEIESTLAVAGYAVICRDPAQALEVANAIAPEHLQLMTAEPESLVGSVRNAGAIFCGPWSPASLGDYVAGPSHVLPTDGTARFSSALTVADFQKHHHVITFTPEQAVALAPSVEAFATAEGLDAHALSARLRREALEGGEI